MNSSSSPASIIESAMRLREITSVNIKEDDLDRRISLPILNVQKMKCKFSGKLLFPVKLYRMLQHCDRKIARWDAEGEYFVICNTNLFLATTLPQYFKQTKLDSFKRQLNAYGFKGQYPIYHHPLFRLGHPELLVDIKRASSKRGQRSTSSSPSSVKDLATSTYSASEDIPFEKLDLMTSSLEKINTNHEGCPTTFKNVTNKESMRATGYYEPCCSILSTEILPIDLSWPEISNELNAWRKKEEDPMTETIGF